MSLPRYPKYKDSGVEWLGEVPEHWDVCAVKRIVSMQSGESITAEDIEDVGDFPVFGGNGLRGYAPRFTHEGDYVLIGRQGALCGNINYGSGKFWASEHAVVASPVLPVATRWLGEMLRAMNLNQYSVSAAQPGLSVDLVANLRTVRPPYVEQTHIAEFLDRETAKIDGLVAEQQRLIELLKEKRQAVVSHAVTRGLNPNAPLKPSGVGWLGDVPINWEVIPLKYLVSLRSGGTPDKENLTYWGGDVPWASSKDLKADELSDTQDHITQCAIDEGVAELVPAGSVLTVVRGMILLHTFPVVVATVPMAINQDLKALTPRARLSADYLPWLLRGASAEVLGRTDEAAHGTKVLRMEAWLSMRVAIPPLREQPQILVDLRKRLGELDALTAASKRAVDLLQERRAALIFAAITGQIDVH